MLFRRFCHITREKSYLYYLCSVIIYSVLFVQGQQFEDDSCTVGNKNGTCTLISNCPSASKNLTVFEERPYVCGFVRLTPIICCFDKTVLRIENNTQTQNGSREISVTFVGNSENNTREIKDRDNITLTLNTTGVTTGVKARKKCIEYSQYIYEWKLPEGETDPNKTIKINNCAHIAAALFIGYEIANTREFPHMALLGYRNEKKERIWLCGGTLISEEYVLTAAHCLRSRSYGAVRWVRLGEQSIDIALESETQDFGVEELIPYPTFKFPVGYNDIALLKLDRIAILNKFVIPACLHVGYEIKEINVIVTGWGAAAFGESGRMDLAKRVLELFSHDECNATYSHGGRILRNAVNDEIMICEGHRTEEKGSCQGDSGGPVQVYLREPYCMYEVLGVTSLGKGCNIPGKPGISTRVSAYISWIETIVWPD